MKRLLDKVFRVSKTSDLNAFLYWTSQQREKFAASFKGNASAEQFLQAFDLLKEKVKVRYPFITFFTKHIIDREDGSSYLERYNIVNCKFIAIRLHRFAASDHDCLHDHPWHFMSVILKGGYYEKTESGRKWIKVGSILFRKATHKHSVQLGKTHFLGQEKDMPAWTLMISLNAHRQWGFWKNGFWQHWKVFHPTQKCD